MKRVSKPDFSVYSVQKDLKVLWKTELPILSASEEGLLTDKSSPKEILVVEVILRLVEIKNLQLVRTKQN